MYCLKIVGRRNVMESISRTSVESSKHSGGERWGDAGGAGMWRTVRYILRRHMIDLSF